MLRPGLGTAWHSPEVPTRQSPRRKTVIHTRSLSFEKVWAVLCCPDSLDRVVFSLGKVLCLLHPSFQPTCGLSLRLCRLRPGRFPPSTGRLCGLGRTCSSLRSCSLGSRSVLSSRRSALDTAYFPPVWGRKKATQERRKGGMGKEEMASRGLCD